MSIEQRPFIGTWSLDGKGLVQHTPDALVYLNGDLTLPGCPKCSGRVEVQKYITEVSVDSGVDAAAAQASITLSLPVHAVDTVARDAQFLFHPGLEVHVYMRGYFPVKGMYSNLAAPQNLVDPANFVPSTPDASAFGNLAAGPTKANGSSYSPSDLTRGVNVDSLSPEIQANLQKTVHSMETLHQYAEQLGQNGALPGYAGGVTVAPSANGGYQTTGHAEDSQHYQGNAIDYKITYKTTSGGTADVPGVTAWAMGQKLRETGYLSPGGSGAYFAATLNPGATAGSTNAADYTPTNWVSIPHYDQSGQDTDWIWYEVPGGLEIKTGTVLPASAEVARDEMPAPDPTLVNPADVNSNRDALNQEKLVAATQASPYTPGTEIQASASQLAQLGLQGQDIENLLAYPYYHVFHGVVISVSHSYSAGVRTITLSCASMLHFWQFHRMNTNASLFGARPSNSKLKMSMVGDNFTGMHPYEIIYTLYKDTMGSAGSVGWALSQKTNTAAVSPLNGQSLWSLAMRYWDARFKTTMNKIRFHGATGELFSMAEAIALSQLSSMELTKLMRSRFGQAFPKSTNPILSLSMLNKLTVAKRIRASQKGENPTASKLELNMPELIAFVSDISQWGQIQLFESTYQSKLDVAKQVCEVTGFEFYQDVDGDFVFKPPMFNLDTSSSRVYRLEDIDIISISFEEKEPEATYMTGKSGAVIQQNLEGLGTDNEFGIQGQYIDYRLVAQYGWRPGSFETSYFTNAASVFYAAVNRMDLMNAPTKSGSATIPLRPEIRPGYPVYIPYLDCYYYVPSFAHSFSVGGQCTTSLQMIAKRAKFYAPGVIKGDGKNPSIDDIDLSDVSLPPLPLTVLDGGGQPKLSGFPNVVMALDPEAINPMFFVIGLEAERLDDPGVQKRLLELGKDLGVLKVEASGSYVMEVDNPVGTKEGTPPNKFRFLFGATTAPSEPQALGGPKAPDGKTTEQAQQGKILGTKQLSELVDEYMAKQAEVTKDIGKKDETIAQVDFELSSIYNSMKRLDITKEEDEKQWDALALKAQTVNQKRVGLIRAREKDRQSFRAETSQDTTTGLAYLLSLVEKVGQKYLTQQSARGSYGNLNSTRSLLDMMSDKKAVFGNNDLPGTYRYYSSAHPNPLHQGPPDLTLTSSERLETGEKGVVVVPATLSGAWANQPTRGYLPAGSVFAPFLGSMIPDAVLTDDHRPVRGIRVLTSDPTFPDGQVVPTSEIMELAFSVAKVRATTQATSTKRRGNTDTLGSSLVAAYSAEIRSKAIPQTSGTTIQDVYKEWYDEVAASVGTSQTAAKEQASTPDQTQIVILPQAWAFPPALTVRGVSVSTTVPIDSLSLASSDPVPVATSSEGEELQASVPSDSGISRDELVLEAGLALARIAAKQSKQAEKTFQQNLTTKQLSKESTTGIVSSANQAMAATRGAKALGKTKAKVSKQKPQTKLAQTAVFPVSDNRGYEVVGTYRYGRGVDIDAEGVWDSLRRVHPLSVLDRQTAENLVTLYTKHEIPLNMIQNGPTGASGVQSSKPADAGSMTVTAAYTETEKEVIKQLQQSYTDKQILDAGWAEAEDGNPNILHLKLRNWIADQSTDGVQKLPIINAGLSLANLTAHSTQEVCSCRAAEADVLLAQAGQHSFVQLAPGGQIPQGYGTGQISPITQVLMSGVMSASAVWQQSQEALRGHAQDRSESSVVKTTLGVFEGDAFKQAQAQYQAALANVEAGYARAETAGSNIGEEE